MMMIRLNEGYTDYLGIRFNAGLTILPQTSMYCTA